MVGLYLDPPVHSLVLSVDENTHQIQALDRTHLGLPVRNDPHVGVRTRVAAGALGRAWSTSSSRR